MEIKSSFWVFVGFGVAVGLAFEMVKAPDQTDAVRHISYRMDDEGLAVPGVNANFSVHKRIRPARLEQKASQVAGLDPAASEKKAETPAAKDAKKDEKKDAKKDEKKKKKKKKKKTVEGAGDQANNQTGDSDSDAKKNSGNDSNDSFQGATGAGTSYATGQFSDDEGRLPETLKEWEDYLLRDPDFKRTSRLIKYFQVGAVKADIFFSVVKEMLDDSREAMKELAVMAYGSAPSSQSFTALVGISRDTRYSKAVITQAATYLKTYAQLQHLSILKNAISLDADSDTNLEALSLLEDAAKHHLRSSSNTNPGQYGTNPRVTSSITRQFTPFLTILTHMFQLSVDTSVRNAAGQALTDLQSLLPTATQAATGPQTGTL
jgi:hypothetical protein